jgi:hypothetical protein
MNRIWLTVCFTALLWAIPADVNAGPRSSDSCPWWRPCGPGETYGGNKLVPQGARGVDFRSACQRHDDCYDTPGVCRKDCDKQLLHDMLALCDEAGNPHGSRLRAYTGYISVRLFGGPSFNNSPARNP